MLVGGPLVDQSVGYLLAIEVLRPTDDTTEGGQLSKLAGQRNQARMSIPSPHFSNGGLILVGWR